MGGRCWEEQAAWWQEQFTGGADPEYEEQILPLARRHFDGVRSLLDVGTGEGQLARLAGETGVELVVGVDPTRAQLEEAFRRRGTPRYAYARAEALPFASAAFDAAIACLVFEHIEPYRAAIGEVARVVRPGGRFLLFLNHPLLQTPGSGWIDDHILDEQYWRVGPYLPESVVDEEVAPGVVLPFAHRPLNSYVNAMVDAGLWVERMEEPAPPVGFLTRAPEYAAAATIPRLLFMLARRRA